MTRTRPREITKSWGGRPHGRRIFVGMLDLSVMGYTGLARMAVPRGNRHAPSPDNRPPARELGPDRMTGLTDGRPSPFLPGVRYRPHALPIDRAASRRPSSPSSPGSPTPRSGRSPSIGAARVIGASRSSTGNWPIPQLTRNGRFSSLYLKATLLGYEGEAGAGVQGPGASCGRSSRATTAAGPVGPGHGDLPPGRHGPAARRERELPHVPGRERLHPADRRLGRPHQARRAPGWRSAISPSTSSSSPTTWRSAGCSTWPT